MRIEESRTIFKENMKEYFKDYFELLKIETISAQKDKQKECVKGATFLSSILKKLGFNSSVIKTGGNPVVFAEYKTKGAKETVLIYGHYDVQPIDPIDEWKSPAFSPKIINNKKIYGRGAQDNKGQLFYVISAVKSLIKEKFLKYNVKFILDGEEESASKNTLKVLPKIKNRLKCDYFLVCDTDAKDKDTGSIILGLRGMCCFKVKVYGLKHDLHSGVFGGVVANPAIELTKLISTFYDKDGKIAIKGFYNGVMPLSKIKKGIVPKYNGKTCKNITGVEPKGGERGLDGNIRAGFRPTLEINGMYSGYQGEGVKTIIPSYAVAKFTCRLVQDQDPKKILEAVKNHVKKYDLSSLKCEVAQEEAGSYALNVDVNHKGIKKATKALKKVCKKVKYFWEGGSIPVLTSIVKQIGKEPILVGFGLGEDNIHAPNETFNIEQFEKGFCFVREFLGEDE